MSQIDDTNIYHRRGEIIAEQVKKKAKEIFDNFSTEALCEMNRHFISENISPGGAADMLALTIFIDAITTSEESRNT
jgi:triphosphoribosyl-dephospho-CoA synthetase